MKEIQKRCRKKEGKKGKIDERINETNKEITKY
jgi:hypothetical protein